MQEILAGLVPDEENYEEMSGLVKKLGLKAIDENERDSLFYKIKIQFYGPFLFNRTFLEKYWHDATKAKLITSTDLKPSVSRKFVTQLALLEKTFKKVCEAFQEVQFYEKWTSDVTALLHITSEVCQFTSVDNAVLEASKIGFFEELRNSLDNHEHCSFILLYCLKHFLHLLNQVVMQSDELLKPLQKISNDAEKRAGFLKRKGNLMFQSNKYQKATKYYSLAIKIDGYNAVLYCNRAQAELFTDQNWEALLDAKRAIVLDPTSPKAYYRYCEALYELQFVEKAVTENQFGQMLCQKSGKDIKALQTQMNRFKSEVDRIEYMEGLCDNRPESPTPLSSDNGESSSDDEIPDYTHMLEDRFSHHFDQGRTVKVEKMSEVKGLTVENFIKAEENRERERLKRLKEEKLEEETRKRNERAKAKRKEEKKKEDQQKELARKEQAEMDSKQAMAKESNTVLGNASKAYLEGRGRQAYEGYQRAVELMSQTKKKFGGITEGDYIIVLYAHGMAALETGNPHHYLSAMEKFDLILTNHKTTRTALPYYGKALTNYKMNQFKEGLDNIEKAMRINDNFETSIETWPGTDVNIKQTESGCMTQTLSALKDNCLNPPPPGAYCRYEGCNTRHEIYFNDMYFKGYVEVLCTEHCKVDYHTNCWKKLKDIRQRNTYRDMLGGTCFTPDCFGVIDDISIYGEDGLVVSKHHSKGQQEKRKVKPSGKQNKKEKKNKKGKHKDKGQGDQSQHEQDFSDVGSHTSVQSLEHVDMVISERSVSVPETVTISVSDTHSEDFTEDSSPMLHQEPSYILKKEEPEPEEKKAPKTKNKKKKKEAVKVEIGFADRDDRQFYSDTNVEEFNQDYNVMSSLQRNVRQDPWLHQEQHQKPIVILSEDDKNQVLVLHLHFAEILENNGPLKCNSSILLDEVSRLSSEHQELINKHGGLDLFLVTAPDMFAVLDDYVCCQQDRSKCSQIIEQQKVEWAPLLPAAGTIQGGSVIRQPTLGRGASWHNNQGHSEGDNKNVKQSNKTYKMNSLDTFIESDLSDVRTYALNGDSDLPGASVNLDTTETLDGELDNMLKEESLKEYHPEAMQNLVDEYERQQVLASEDILKPSNQFVANGDVQKSVVHKVGRNLTLARISSAMLDSTKEESDKQTRERTSFNGEVAGPYEDVLEAGSSRSVNGLPGRRDKTGAGDYSIGGRAYSVSEEENVNKENKEDELDDTVKRCSSGETVSSDSISSGISVDKDALIPWKKSARALLSLFPEVKAERVNEDDEILLKVFSGPVFNLVEGLKERSNMPQKKRSLLRSVGTLTHRVSFVSKGVNTDAFKTYQAEFSEAVRRVKKVEDQLRDANSKNKALESVMSTQQNNAKANQLEQKSKIESLERMVVQKEEKYQRDFNSANLEKTRLQSIVRLQEAQARETKSRLDQFSQVKQEADRLTTQIDTLCRDRDEMQKKMDDMDKECQMQRQRAIKSEVSVVQIHKDQALRPLEEAISECQYHMNNLKRILQGEENANLTVILKDWERCREENKQKMETIKSQFDSQIQELQSGRLILTDLPVIPRPEPSRSKTLKAKHAPHNWPTFGTPPPLPGSTIAAPPSHLPPHAGGSHQAPQKPLDSPPTIPPPTTPPLNAFGLPPAKGIVSAVPRGPGSTMPLAPGPATGPPPGLWHMPSPIGTRSNGTTTQHTPGQPTTTATTTKMATFTNKVNHASNLHPETSLMNPTTARFQPRTQGMIGDRRTTVKSSYQRIMERLEERYPNYNKVQLTNFLRVVRVNNGNSLSGLSMEGIMDKVSDQITEAEAKVPQSFLENNRETFHVPQTPARGAPLSFIPAAPPSSNPWSTVDDTTTSWKNEVYDDEIDPCAICHEEMALKEVLDLECGHRFHADCIVEWLGTKSTCPNCRKFTKLKQDFPPLAI
ncbi:uncharacterized protein [Apostichopus japonicus]|uniref:uncharacterized protein n=1 Tax=Stichopus japonicus TaxID=307972 RepID=UPI003AB3EFC0